MNQETQVASAENTIEVVGGVLLQLDARTDGHTRILLTQRMPPCDFSYAFESPGGKVDPGETHLAAVARELGEEIGVTSPTFGVPLFSGVFPRPRGGFVRWTVYPVLSWVGKPQPREGQGIGWFTLDEMIALALTPGNRGGLAAIAAYMQGMQSRISNDEET